MSAAVWTRLKALLELRRPYRRGTGSFYRKLKSIEYLLTRDRAAILGFLTAEYPLALPLEERLRVIARFIETTNAVRAYHTQAEMLVVADRILRLAGRPGSPAARPGGPGLTVVEAGAGKGASTAKLSLAVRAAGGRLLVFDSFRGIPENGERHTHLDGRPVVFHAGAFTGRLSSVQRTVEQFGAPEVCEFHKGWFEDTLAGFTQPIDLALLDVDLLSSTRTCIRHLFPRLRPGGSLFTQDGHLRAIVDLLGEQGFWRDEVGVEAPLIPGLGREKLLEIRATGLPAPATTPTPTARDSASSASPAAATPPVRASGPR